MFYDQWPIENVKLQLSLPAFHPLLFVHNGKITFVIYRSDLMTKYYRFIA